MQVIKIGGLELEQLDFIAALAGMLRTDSEPTVLVHGGGPALDQMQRKLGLSPRKVDGLRVTRSDDLEAAHMVLSGSTNKRLTATLAHYSVPAVGLSGIDGGLITCRKVDHDGADLGWVGQVEAVEPSLLTGLMQAGFVPVVSPLSTGKDGAIYNVNADEVAGALAGALGASSLAIVSNVPGVIIDGRVVRRADLSDIEAWLASGKAEGGMIPKLRAAAYALRHGVPRVFILDSPALADRGGTAFIPSRPASVPYGPVWAQ